MMTPMSTTLAVANQKGGVAKTTSVASIGAALAELGQSVLLVDLDPQACLTWSTGTDPDQLGRSLHDVLVHKVPAADVRLERDEMHLLPSTIDLAGAELHLLSRAGREYVLQRALQPLLDDYDVVLIDCPPSLGILTINGLTAAQEVLVPLQCETLSHRGVGQLMETVGDVRSYTNPTLAVTGVVPTMYDGRTRLAQQVLASVGEQHGLRVLEPPVPKSVRVAEAPSRGRSVLRHAPRSPVAHAYRELADVIWKAGR
jgi:chromosome partitioning protein